MGRMGFVSPGAVVGVEVGCFNGQSKCVGTVKLTFNGTELGQRNFSLAAETGAFQNIKLSSYGKSLLSRNRVNDLIAVDAEVTTTSGQTLSHTFNLARWLWH